MSHELVEAYKVLGVNSSVTDEELKKVYRKLSRQCHPDYYVQFGPDAVDEAKKKFQKMKRAYETIIEYRGKNKSNNLQNENGNDSRENSADILEAKEFIDSLDEINLYTLNKIRSKRENLIIKQEQTSKIRDYTLLQKEFSNYLDGIIVKFEYLCQMRFNSFGMNISSSDYAELFKMSNRYHLSDNSIEKIKKVFFGCLSDFETFHNLVSEKIPSDFLNFNPDYAFDNQTFLICNGSSDKWRILEKTLSYVDFNKIEYFYDSILELVFQNYGYSTGKDEEGNLCVDPLSLKKKFYDLMRQTSRK